MVVVSFKMSKAEKEWLDKAARRLGMTTSQLIKEAVKWYLEAKAKPWLEVPPKKVVLRS